MSATDTAVTPYLDAGELAGLDAYWRAANYLSVGQIYLLDNPLLREPLALEHDQAAPARPLGHDARAQPALRPREPRDPARAGSTCSTSPARVTAGRASSRTRGSRARTPSATRGSRATAWGCSASSASSRSRRHPEPRRARDARLDPRGRRARLRAHARLRRGVRQPGPDRAAASSATARPRPARSRRAGTGTSSSTRGATAPSSRCCTSTATRSPTRRCFARIPEDELRRADGGLRLRAALRHRRRPRGGPPRARGRRSTAHSTRSAQR